MHRARRVGDYWNWLPVFRVVAETRSLRDAAATLHVAASALSRTIRLLEESLGHPLFERTGGALVLNAEGRRLLESVRAAMRIVDDAHAAASDDAPSPCHIHCAPDLVAPLLVEALDAWIAAHPSSPPVVHVPCSEDVAAQLLRGDLDVVIALDASSAAGISSELLGEFSSGVYCAATHPARRRSRLTEKDLRTLAFIDYPVAELPYLRLMRDRERQSVAYVPTMELAASLCARGVGLACIPDFVAERVSPPLHRFRWLVPSGRLFIWFRKTLPNVPRPAMVEHLLAWPRFAVLSRGPESTAG